MLFAWLWLSKWELLFCCLFFKLNTWRTSTWCTEQSAALCSGTKRLWRNTSWGIDTDELKAISSAQRTQCSVRLEEKHFMTHTGMQCNTSLTSIILFPWRWEANWSWNLITCPLLKEAKTGLGPQHKFYSSSIQALTCKSGRSQWGSRWKRSMVSRWSEIPLYRLTTEETLHVVMLSTRKRILTSWKWLVIIIIFYYYMFTICL